MKIYEKIFDRLDELHMSQMELSRRTGIATSTISDWRKKKINPQADKIVSICRALDMSLVDLLCDEETVEPAAQIDCLTNENYMIELFRQSDAESKRRIISYIELLEVCKQINNACQSRKRQRNVSIIQDIDGNNIVVINDIRFKGKRSINWREVRAYLKEYVLEMLYILELIYQMNIVVRNIHIVLREQMPRRKQMQHREFLK